MSNSPYEGMWDFQGACAPPENAPNGTGHPTFSLGCFQWELRSGSKTKLKKGRTRHRIQGTRSDIKLAYDKAREFCKLWNESDKPFKSQNIK